MGYRDHVDLAWDADTDRPASGAAVEVRMADGTVREEALDDDGRLHLADVPPGPVEALFGPDPRVWEPTGEWAEAGSEDRPPLARLPLPADPIIRAAPPILLASAGSDASLLADLVRAQDEDEGGFIEWLWGTLKGDFNEDPTYGQIVATMAVTWIPVVDQVADIRDIIAGIYLVVRRDGEDKRWVWFALVTTLVGIFPVFGSLLKGVLRIAAKGLKTAGSGGLDVAADVLRKVFERVGVGDPAAWARALDRGRILTHAQDLFRWASDHVVTVSRWAQDRATSAFVRAHEQAVGAAVELGYGVADGFRRLLGQTPSERAVRVTRSLADRLGAVASSVQRVQREANERIASVLGELLDGLNDLLERAGRQRAGGGPSGRVVTPGRAPDDDLFPESGEWRPRRASGLQTNAPSGGGPSALQSLQTSVAGGAANGNLQTSLQTNRINWAGELMSALTFVDLVASTADAVAKAREGHRDRNRGATVWDAYLVAVGSGTGAFGAFAGVADEVGKRFITSGPWGPRLLYVGKVSGAVGLIASAIAFGHEYRTHDGFGMTSAGLAFASSATLLLLPRLVLMAPALGPYGLPAVVLLALASLAVNLLSHTPVEEWLVRSVWSLKEPSELPPHDAWRLFDEHEMQLEIRRLVDLLAAPTVSVELWEPNGSGGRRLASYETGFMDELDANPDQIRLVVKPGLLSGGGRIELKRFQLTTARGSVVYLTQRNRSLVLPDPSLDLVVERDNGAPYFVRTWDIEAVTAASSADFRQHGTVRVALGAGVMTASFECTATLRLAGDSGVQDPSFRYHGSVGFARGDQVQGVGTTGEPVG